VDREGVERYVRSCGWDDRFAPFSLAEGMADFAWFRDPVLKFFKIDESNPKNIALLEELRGKGELAVDAADALGTVYEIRGESREAYVIRGWRPAGDGYELVRSSECPNDGYMDKDRFHGVDLPEGYRRRLRQDEIERLMEKTREARRKLPVPW
jgi:hypothetical protein